MTIDGEFYKNDIRGILRVNTAGLSLQEIKAKLLEKKIKIDEIQILTALDGLIRNRIVTKSNDGRFYLIAF